ncbi:MAG TPA: efflux RND transporter periplasmic adaptor subunit [Bacteroidota bacterium]|nr:efflux RND transporter periplasmic adaptor subunit [Bacteroidota bacterium]
MKQQYAAAATLLLGSIILASCSVNKAAEQKGPPPVQVATFEAKAGSAVYYDEYPAAVVALNQVELRPQVSGYISEIFFKDGEHVAKGTKLYAIDQQQYRAAYDQAVANLNVAKSNLFKAQQDADRYTDLAKNDAVARQTLEHALADLASVKMQVEAAEATVKSVETNLRYSVLYAPFDGTVGISLVKLGSAVSTGQTLLNTISSDDPMAVDCAVDERLIPRFSELLRNPMNGKDSTFTVVLPDQSVYPLAGHLSLLDRAVDPQTGTIRVRVIFSNPQRLLKAGLTCNLRVRASSPGSSILIPYKSVVEQMGEFFVFVLNGNKVTQRRVVLGMNVNDMVIVKDGLRAGEQVVVEGMQRLRDNALVAVAPAGAPAAAQPPRGS